MVTWLVSGAFAAVMVVGFGSGQARAVSGCPQNEVSSARIVVRALSQERLAWFRRKYHLEQLKPKHLRRLANGRSDAVCAQLNAYYASSFFMTPRFKRTYYRAGAYYFASFVDRSHRDSGRVFMNHFALFDSRLQLVATLSPK